ncbi:MAG TPA: AAA family ATPase [Acidimicrobiales bacterium]|nr:AAA family ATPase [Acidimicrobiales bacterium]
MNDDDHDRMARIRSMVAVDELPEFPLAWDAVDLAPVLRGERVTLPPSVLARSDGVKLLYPGRTHVIMGETETGKTWLALLAACQELALGHHVLYLDYEDTVELAVERLVTLGTRDDDVLARFSYYESPPALSELGQELICARCAERGEPSLVILDGVTEVMSALGLDPEKGTDVAKFYGGMPLWFAGMGAAVVMLDNVVKNETNRGRWAIGSERKVSGLSGAAYAMTLVKPFGRGRLGSSKVTVSKDRPGHMRQHEGAGRAIATFELESWPDDKASARLSVPDPAIDFDQPLRPTHIMERVSRTLEAASAPLSGRAVRTQTTGNASVVSTALELLVAEGFVEPVPGPRNAVLHRSLRPFRDS